MRAVFTGPVAVGCVQSKVTPRSSLLQKSVRVDRGDAGPASNIKRWENCATQDSSEMSLARSGCARQMNSPRHPEGAHAKCGVLRAHTGEVCSDHLDTLYSGCSRDSSRGQLTQVRLWPWAVSVQCARDGPGVAQRKCVLRYGPLPLDIPEVHQ